ncbi:DNA-binding domain superfamily [Sesbania bispinosa]|nr:DNA-binding domain superfamily [Sesbania bispinosa]
MKPIQNVNNQNNWLGFSLTPQINIGVPPQSQPSSAAETLLPSFYHPTHVHNYGFYYGLEGENVGLYSALPIMPFKSDGSLYGIESLSRSQAQALATTSTPKLETFFRGQTMTIPQYECNTKEAMHLSLESMFYNQTFCHDPNNPNNLNHVHENISQQQLSYNSSLRNHDVMLEGSKQNQLSDSVQLPNMFEDLKNWVSRDFPGSHAQQSKMIVPVEDNGGESGSIGSMTYGELQSLSLSMSPSSQSSCVTSSQQTTPPALIDSVVALDTKKRGPEMVDLEQNQKQMVLRKSIDTFGQRTSQYRGVTRHRWTGRYEAHLWDNSWGYDVEEKAARAYDMAALKYWGPSTHINFPLENYHKEVEEMKNMTRQEYVAHLRRKSSGFSRGASIYRGVTRHHQHGRWQARIGRVAGNKDLYLGTFSTQEEAGEAYDIAAIKFRGVNAVTNFDITRYDVEKIMASNNLLSSELARRNKVMDGGTGKEAIHHEPLTCDDTLIMQKRCKSQSEWEMVLYQKEAEELSKIGRLVSNPSSLVTSLSSSREESPDKTSLPVLFDQMPSTASKLLATISTSNVGSWEPSSHLRPALSLPQMPVFSAWTDA